MFLKILQVSQENTCVGVSFLQAKFSRTPSFTEHGDVLLWFLQQSNLIFHVITITLSYNQKLSWRYCHYYHIPYIKISISCQKYAHLVQKFYSLSQQSPNFMILSSIYFCITSIFLTGSSAFQGFTLHLMVSLSKTDCPIYLEENSTLPQKCSWNYSMVIKIHLQFVMLIKISAIQNFMGLSVNILYKLFLLEPWF